MTQVLLHGKQVLWCGNGGSASDAHYLAAELVRRYRRDRPGLASIALTENAAAMIGIANDYGFNEVFARQVEALCQAGDVFVGISTSGNSRNEASELSRMLEIPPYILSGIQLREVCAVLHECDLFLGNDTGTAHLAAAMNCPTVVVSRHPENGDPNHANSPARFGPLCAGSRVLQPLWRAGDCRTSCGSKEPHCILQVTVKRAVACARIIT